MERICIMKACGSKYYPDCGLSSHKFLKDPNVRVKCVKLKHASRFVFEILKYTVKLLFTLSKQSLKNVHKNKLIMYVVQEFYNKLHTLLDPPHPPQHMFEEPHDIQLVKALANSYLNLCLTHNAK